MTVLVGYVPTPLGEATLRAGVAECRRRSEPLLVVNMSRDDVLVDAHRAATDDLDRVERFAILVVSDEAGATVLEAPPPPR
jgi:hypothetical protein